LHGEQDEATDEDTDPGHPDSNRGQIVSVVLQGSTPLLRFFHKFLRGSEATEQKVEWDRPDSNLSETRVARLAGLEAVVVHTARISGVARTRVAVLAGKSA
jgi:hypothetical protein